MNSRQLMFSIMCFFLIVFINIFIGKAVIFENVWVQLGGAAIFIMVLLIIIHFYFEVYPILEEKVKKKVSK